MVSPGVSSGMWTDLVTSVDYGVVFNKRQEEGSILDDEKHPRARGYSQFLWITPVDYG